MNFSQSSVKKYPFRDTLFTTIIVTGRDKKKTHLCKSYRRKISPPPPPPQTNTDLRLLRGLKSDINEEIEHFRPILLIIGPRTFKFTAEYIMLIRTEVRNVPEFSPMQHSATRRRGLYIWPWHGYLLPCSFFILLADAFENLFRFRPCLLAIVDICEPRT